MGAIQRWRWQRVGCVCVKNTGTRRRQAGYAELNRKNEVIS